MATIEKRRTHTKGKDHARKAAEVIAEKLKDKINVTYHWAGDDLEFKRTGASGRIRVSETDVRVEIDLSLVLRPMKGMIEEKVEKYLDETLG